MATIRAQQLAPVNFGDSNQLLRAAQQLIQQGAGGLVDTFGQLRQNVVDRNTANAVNLLTGAQTTDELAQRQGQVAQILQAANGDINNEAVQRAQLTMPDTLIGRQLNNNRLTEFNQQQHDQPLLNQAMALYAAGDQAGAQNLLAGVQGDASRALTFGANRADQAFNQNIQKQQLGIQQAGLALRRQAAASRAGQTNRLSAQLQTLLKNALSDQGKATQESTKVATREKNAQLDAAEKDSLLNNPKSDVNATVRDLNSNAWFSNPGTRINNLIDQLDPDKTLTDSQRVNLLTAMYGAFDQNNHWYSSTDPDKAALDLGKKALDQMGNIRTQRLTNNQAQIDQRLASQREQTMLLLQNLLSNSNGSPNPLLLQQILQPDEE